ncbi:hypothetical protein E2I00_012452 [Balaenoptera physalus]|uniref:Uncharacterized protein n=1 Tax=Balaenoptera physalus TaxID=9770 RepID=A0A643CJK8_BALPH|nr:hypothetical protein E2I00_012452 [Balaenoptera physalus]
MSTVSYGQSQAGEVDSNPSTTEKRPREATAEEASLVSGEQYPGGLVPIDFGEATAGGEDLDEDMTCEMMLAMMEK